MFFLRPEHSFKDINFSKGSVEWCWEKGYNDVIRAIELSGWLAEVSSDTSLVVHEITPCTIDTDTKECTSTLNFELSQLLLIDIKKTILTHEDAQFFNHLLASAL
ncbi:MAG: DUF3734 domain-containing protein [Burkholderiaceae bacterium]